jgi:excisionase family DNA binding protein
MRQNASSRMSAARGAAEVLPLLLRPDEVATALGLNRATVYAKLITPGILPSIRIGRSRRVARADLEAYVEHLRAATSEGAGDTPPAL